MSIKIGIDYTSAIHQTAGIGRYTREMVWALAESPAFRPQYCLFAAEVKGNSLPPPPGPNFSWCSTALTERWLARLWHRLRLPLPVESWTGSLDLFHAPDFFLPPTRGKTRTVVTVHDLSFIREPESVMPGMSTPLKERVPRSVARADHVIAVSEATCRDLVELYQTPPEKISVLYHGVMPQFRPVTDPAKLAEIRQKYRLGKQPFVLSVGTLQPRKNYSRLIQAMARVAGDVSLVIAGGRGWHTDDIFDEVKKQGVEERVHFPGFVAEEDLPTLYSAATVFAYPSLYEGFGLPALEAMACGTPVIASNCSSLPEVVGEAGLLVNPRDVAGLTAAISQLLSDQALQQQLAAAGRHRAAQFTWPGMANGLIKIYQQILENR